MQPINLEHELHNFQDQKYPTLEQTITNNQSVLSKRKQFFTTDLKQSVQVVEIVLIIIIYLRDLSFFRLFLRSTIHFAILNINPDYVSRYYSFSTHHVKTMIKMSFRGVIFMNLYCGLMHLIFGVYSKSPSSSGGGGGGSSNGGENYRFLHGGLTVQFIGERLPFNRLELIVLDIIVFGIQLILLHLHGVVGNEEVFDEDKEEQEVNDGGEENSAAGVSSERAGDGSAVRYVGPLSSSSLSSLQGGVEEIPLSELCNSNHTEEAVIDKARIEGDGYNGNVQLLTIDLIDGIKKMMNLKVNIQNSRESSGLSTSSSTFPGAFPRVSSLV